MDNGLIALSLLFWGLGSGLYMYIWPIYVADLGAGPFEVGLLLGMGGASSIAGFVFGGRITDRINWRTIVLAGWGLGTLAGLAYLLAESWWALLPGVFCLSFSGFCDPALSSYIAAGSGTRQLGRAFATVFSGFSLGMAISPPLGGWISAQLGMRPLFALTFALYLISTLILLAIRSRGPEDQVTPARFLDGRGTSYLAPLRVPGFRRLVVVLLGLFTTGFLGVSLAPLFLSEQVGLPVSLVGSLGTLASLGGVGTSLWLARTSDRMGLHRALALTELFLVASFLLILGARALGSAGFLVVDGIAGLAYLMRGSLAAQTSLARASVLQVIDGPLAGRGFAIELITLGAAQTVGPALAGFLYSQDPHLPLLASAVGGLAFALLAASRPLAAPVPAEAVVAVHPE